MKNIYKLSFGLILLVAIILRFWKLGQIPYSLNWDEISHGYNAYSLIQTGKDQWGASWPMFNFRAYGDFPTTANLYLSIPFIWLFGLNAFSIRLPAAILGVTFVVFNYLISKIIFKKEKFALICMFLAAISPWTVFPSRGVFQSNLSQVLLLAGLYYFFKSLKKPRFTIISALSLGLSLYAYHNTRIATPIIIVVLMLFYHDNLIKNYLKNRFTIVSSIVVFMLLAIPNLLNLFSVNSLARNRWVGIINPNSINLINEERRIFYGPQIINRLINNKVVYFTKTISVNYLNLLNPIPLFFEGSQNYQFNPPQTGLLFLIFSPFFYYGLYIFIRKSTVFPSYLLILIIFLVTLLPAAMTVGDFPSIRATVALPFYFIFITFGITSLRISNSKLFLFTIFFISILHLINYYQTYLRYNVDYSQNWQYGYEQATKYIKQNYTQYNHIVMTKKYGEPHEFILFYWPWDPGKYQHDTNLKWDFHSDWYWVNAFDKFEFVNDWEIKNLTLSKNTLLITSPDNFPKANSQKLNSINFLNGSTAFDIITYD